jgi:hypothetical protein
MSLKKILFIYFEGKSEANFFEAIVRIKEISKNYCFKKSIKENDLSNAIEKSKNIGIECKKIFIYDNDVKNQNKKLKDNIEENGINNIYISDKKFEDFLDVLLGENQYYENNKKPKFKLTTLQKIENMKIENFQSLENIKNYKDFKNLKDLIIELFENKL